MSPKLQHLRLHPPSLHRLRPSFHICRDFIIKKANSRPSSATRYIPRTCHRRMNVSTSLFATATKDPNYRPGRFTPKKSIPFSNYWVPEQKQDAGAAGQGSIKSYSTGTEPAKEDKMASATSFYDFKPLDKKGQPVPLTDYSNKVVLVVNTASKCGFTPQYEGLEKLYQKLKAEYGDEFQILGFPCNQFGGQEPGSDDDIQSFCQLNYGVSFPIMGKTDVNGDKADPLFEWMKKEQPGLLGMKRVKWNFEKFLIGRDGKVKGRWASTTKPEALEKPIVEELGPKK